MSTAINLANLPEHDQEALRALQAADNLAARIDYPTFVMDTLGFDFPEIHDPRVQEHLHRVGGIFTDWVLNTRQKQTKFRRIMDIRPRGTCKSATVTQPLIPFLHLHDPEIATAIISARFEGMATKFSNVVRQVWEDENPNSRLVDTFGQFKPTSVRQRAWSSSEMVTQKRTNLAHADPTLRAYSIAQGPTSGHFKAVIVDDPVTDEMMERDSRWLDKVWNGYENLKFVLDTDAILYLIMTRYHQSDLVGRIIENEIKPAARLANAGEVPADFHKDRGWVKYAHLAGWEVFYDSVYEDYDATTRTGKTTYPTIWTIDKIQDSRQTVSGEGKFWSQLMNQPSSRDDAPVKQEHIDRLWVPNIQAVPKRAFLRVDIHCDFAFKDSESYLRQDGDWNVLHVTAKDAGTVYRIHGYRSRDTQEKFGIELCRVLRWLWDEHNTRVRYVTYEQASGAGSGDESIRLWMNQLFSNQPDYPRPTPYPIRRNRGANKKRGKLARIMNMNWAWQEGYVQLVEEAPHNQPLIHQVLNQGYTDHDDDADAFADAFHEELYVKTTRGDLPDAVADFYSNDPLRWKPEPNVFGSHDPFTGRFVPERRTAQRPEARRNNTLTRAHFGNRRK